MYWLRFFRSRFLAVLLIVSTPTMAWADVAAYILGPNDKVKVNVFGEPDLSGDFEISGSGMLALPLVGQVRVGGLTLSQAAITVADHLRGGFLKDPKVSVEVLNYRPFFILGEVNTPGSYPYVNGMTVVNAAAIGGGFTYRADKKDIKISRESQNGKTEIEARVDSPVQPGDIIWVGERFF